MKRVWGRLWAMFIQLMCPHNWSRKIIIDHSAFGKVGICTCLGCKKSWTEWDTEDVKIYNTGEVDDN